MRSKAGPVRIIGHLTPQPLTEPQQIARLRHKLVLIENRIAARESFYGHRRKVRQADAVDQLDTLLKQREHTQKALASFGE